MLALFNLGFRPKPPNRVFRNQSISFLIWGFYIKAGKLARIKKEFDLALFDRPEHSTLNSPSNDLEIASLTLIGFDFLNLRSRLSRDQYQLFSKFRYVSD